MLQLNFKPESEQFETATREYSDIWNSEGIKILGTFKTVTGLDFKQTTIEVVVYEGPSFSGKKDTPMKLRASYTQEEKRAALVHELGHRLIAPLHNRLQDVDEHRHLNLFLCDAWSQMYGSDFADRMVKIEKGRKGLYDYESAWNWLLSLSKEQKKALWDSFVNLN